MDAKLYATAYKNQRPWRERDADPARQEFFDDSATWTGKFSDILLQRLSGEPLESNSVDTFLESYKQWYSYTLYPKITDKSFFDDNPDDTAAEANMREASFHAVNVFSLDSWRAYLLKDRLPDLQMQQTQIDSAAFSVNAMTEPFKRLYTGELYDARGTSYAIPNRKDRFILSLASQLDTQVALLDAAQTQPNRPIILPAPPLFENGVDNIQLNADFIAFDQTQDTAHGYQVKLNARAAERRHPDKYDEAYVTVIDCMHDLKNFVTVRGQDTGQPTTVPAPGLYSAHHLLGSRQVFRNRSKKGQGILDRNYATYIMRAKTNAREITRKLPSVNDATRTHIATAALSRLSV